MFTRKLRQWRRSVVKSEGSGSLKSSHQTRSRPKFVFVFGAENELFGRVRLYSFSAENEFSSLFYSSFSFPKCHLRWAENFMFADTSSGKPPVYSCRLPRGSMLEQNIPYQCLVQVYFGAANERCAIAYTV